MKILIVEDSKFAQVVNNRLFSEAFPDSQIFLSSNGVNGYKEFLRVRPDIIVTDLLMPSMSGQDLIKEIRLIDPNVMIVVVTADVQYFTKNELAEYNIAAFINKPLDPNKVASIKRSLEDRFHD